MSFRGRLTLAFFTSLLFASRSLCQSTPSKACPLAGAVYPVPSKLSQSDVFSEATDAFNAALDSAFKSESLYGPLGNDTSFSIQIYSLHEQSPLLTHHYSAPLLSQPESGVSTVDSNTIYRLGSISKLITTYIYLINAGWKGWNDPITKYVPELREYAEQSKDHPINVVAWDEVTVGSLASHLSGINRDGAPPPSTDAQLAAAGLPEVPGVPGEFCGDPEVQEFPCDDAVYLQDILYRHPILPTFAHTPIYSNSAWRLFTMALQNITGTPFPELFTETFAKPLELNSTYRITPPSGSQSIIPVNESVSWYTADLRAFGPAGGHFSTINDLRKVGTAILSSSLIPASLTRHWMKPMTFTADAGVSVGAPWEIFRSPLNRTSWMYTKSGDLGLYSNNMILLPEYDIGITILTAGLEAPSTSRTLSDIVTDIFVPVMEEGAKQEAQLAYEGVYTDAATNSSITLAVLDEEPGVVIANWTFGGVDVFSVLGLVYSTTSPILAHMYPTGLHSVDGRVFSWRAIFEVQRPKGIGLFSSLCSTWFSADGLVYGGQSIGEFLFHVDGDGNVEEVEFRMLNIPMEKTEGRLKKKSILRD